MQFQSRILVHPHPGFLCREPGWLRVLYWAQPLVAFDHLSLAVQSQDLTTFQTPLGLLHLTTLPMGATNSVQILQGDISIIIQEEMPEISGLPSWMMWTLGVHQLVTRPMGYGWYVLTHLQTHLPNWLLYPVLSARMVIILRLFQKMLGSISLPGSTSMTLTVSSSNVKRVGGTFLGWKMDICVLEVVAVGHRCTYKGCYPEDCKVQKIIDWPDCNTLMEVQGFPRHMQEIIRIWVKDFARHAKPLISLNKEGHGVCLGADQKASMEDLKQVIVTAPCLRPIAIIWTDVSFWPSTCLASPLVSFSLSLAHMTRDTQAVLVPSLGMNENHATSKQDRNIWSLACPSGLPNFTSLVSKIFQSKLMQVISKGCSNNPDIQPGAAVNRWIVGIKLFQFELVHVSRASPYGPDGLSHCAASPNDPNWWGWGCGWLVG